MYKTVGLAQFSCEFDDGAVARSVHEFVVECDSFKEATAKYDSQLRWLEQHDEPYSLELRNDLGETVRTARSVADFV